MELLATALLTLGVCAAVLLACVASTQALAPAPVAPSDRLGWAFSALSLYAYVGAGSWVVLCAPII